MSDTEPENEDEHLAVDHAAEAPTAVWDQDALRKAGVEIEDEHSQPRGAAPPQIQTVEERRAGLSWPLTFALAVVLGVAVYFLVRLIR